MLNVVIIDDETLVRVGLKSMINWEEHGYQIVGEASNGQEGLGVIKKCKPDLVITDIKMPIMDGIEMISAAVKSGEKPKFIILSGYDDFHLVRQAMKLEACEYLIKLELEPDNLLNILDQIKERMEIKQAESARKGFLEMQLRINTPVVRDEFFRKLIGKVIRDKWEVEENIRHLNIQLDEDRLVCGYIMVNEQDNLNKFGKEDMQLFDFSVINIVEEILNDTFKGYCFKWNMGEYAFVISYANDWDEDLYRIKMTQAAERLIQMLKQYFSVAVTIGISEIYNDLLETGKSFIECAQAAEMGKVKGLDCFIFYRDYIGKQSQYNSRLIAKAKRYISEHIKEEIKLNDLAEVLSLSPGYVSTLFKQVTGQNFVDYVTEEKICYAKKLLNESNMKIYEVSEMLGYENAYYFSRVFKKVTGITPSQYLIK